MSLNLRKRFKTIADPLGLFSKPKAGELPDIKAASADNYLRNLRVLQAGLRMSASGLISPSLQINVAKILSEHGMATDELGKALTSGALTIPYLEASNLSGDVARQLSDFQTAIAQAKAGVPKPQQTGAAIAQGAAEGLASTGSWIGAAVGAVSGRLKNKQEKSHAMTIKKALADAERLASPENFAANLAKVQAASREETFVGGQQAQLSEEAAISGSGLRGTGIGTQASIAASAASDIAALRHAVSGASAITGNEVSARLGTPVRPPKTTLVDALGAAAGVAGALLSPEEKAKRFRNKQISGGTSYTDTIGSNIYQPTVGEV